MSHSQGECCEKCLGVFWMEGKCIDRTCECHNDKTGTEDAIESSNEFKRQSLHPTPVREDHHDKNGHLTDIKGNLIFDPRCHGCDAPREEWEEFKQGSLYGYDLVLKVPRGARDKTINENTLKNHIKRQHRYLLERLEEEVEGLESRGILFNLTDSVSRQEVRGLITNFKKDR